VKDEDDAIAGASDIIAEWASESTRLRNITRNTFRRSASVECTPAKGKEQELASSPYAQYGDFTKNLRHLPSHQYLALRRAEREGLLKVKYSLGNDSDKLDEALCRAFVPAYASRDAACIIENAVCDASRRLLRPSVENEVSAELKEEADRVAIDIFAGNLRQLILASPLKGEAHTCNRPGLPHGLQGGGPRLARQPARRHCNISGPSESRFRGFGTHIEPFYRTLQARCHITWQRHSIA